VRAHRGRPRPTVLLLGDSTDLAELDVILSTLPRDAYGQVFVEVASAVQVECLVTPARVAVTWLVRETEAGMTTRGELLVRAVDGWLTEWAPAMDTRSIVWVGCSSRPDIADRYRAVRELPFESVRLED
jgi:NADPH-dependent ferric siderophore reductase